MLNSEAAVLSCIYSEHTFLPYLVFIKSNNILITVIRLCKSPLNNLFYNNNTNLNTYETKWLMICKTKL